MRNQQARKGPCCCSWGLMRPSDGFPEFPCWRCPQHGGKDSVMGSPNEMCKRHVRAAQGLPNPLVFDHEGPTPSEVEDAISSIRKDMP